LSLKKNFIWAFIGNAISAFFMWLLLVVLAKQATVETMGDFGIAQAISLPVNMLLSLKLQTAQVTDAKNEFDFGHYYALQITTSIMTIFATIIIAFSFYKYSTAINITALGIAYSIMTFREVFLAVLQKHERMDMMAGSRVFESVFSFMLFGIFFWLSKSLVCAISGLVISRIIVLTCYDVPVSKKLLRKNGYCGHVIPRWHLSVIWRLFKMTVPLGLVAWLSALFISIPRLFLDKFSGRQEVGYFVAISSLLAAGTLIATALTQTVGPRLAKYYEENIKAYEVLLLKLVVLGIGLGITGIVIAVFAGKLILTILFRAEYGQYNNVLVILAIAGLLLILFSFMNVGLTAARRFLIQVPLYIICAVVCGVSAICLVPRYGMFGAAISLIFCYLVGFIGCVYHVKRCVHAKMLTLVSVVE
jgi:O-antigen/teichoic acid export membrane protein